MSDWFYIWYQQTPLLTGETAGPLSFFGYYYGSLEQAQTIAAQLGQPFTVADSMSRDVLAYALPGTRPWGTW